MKFIKKAGKYKKKINQLTFGLFDTLIDFSLFVFFFSVQAQKMGKGKTGPLEAIEKAVSATKAINANSLKRVIYKAKTRGYLQRRKDYFKISKLGKERLARAIPVYEQERPWDGIIYLITYDIPESRKMDRDFLRQYLIKIGCGMLQQSVWLTPYNPKALIADLVKQKKLVGLILVSELREGSSIGGKNILAVLEKVYKLDSLNDKYRQFVRTAEKGELKGLKLIMAYFAILKNDPQLPFELLPDGFWGEDAYEIYEKELKKLKTGIKAN